MSSGNAQNIYIQKQTNQLLIYIAIRCSRFNIQIWEYYKYDLCCLAVNVNNLTCLSKHVSNHCRSYYLLYDWC